MASYCTPLSMSHCTFSAAWLIMSRMNIWFTV